MGVAQRWDESRWGPLCIESVRALHQPPERFRVVPGCYPAGTSFVGSARASRKYVLAGLCSYVVAGVTWGLRTGEMADSPGGDFAFRVLGDNPVVVVSVYELPVTCWGSVPDAEPGTAAG